MKKQKTVLAAALLLLILAAMAVNQIQIVKAQDEIVEDPSLRIIVDGAPRAHGTGWYAGYIVTPNFPPSGSPYTLLISAQGPERLFPVADVQVLFLFSEDAKNHVQTLKLGSTDVIASGTLVAGVPWPYKNNGVFN